MKGNRRYLFTLKRLLIVVTVVPTLAYFAVEYGPCPIELLLGLGRG